MIRIELKPFVASLQNTTLTMSKSLEIAGLFAGIGGLELGLQRAGHSTKLLCEIDPRARRILGLRFPGIRQHGDIETLSRLPKCDLVTAGFPCQDLSQCGQTKGIAGSQSSLVNEVFRLVENSSNPPEWLLFENVPFMLRLDRGKAISDIVSSLENLGYSWAYRTVNAQAFGVPQRRLRVVLLASLNHKPQDVLLCDSFDVPTPAKSSAFGFYWTEGNRGLGWAPDAVPTLKGGSGLGIPSSPAIWIPHENSIRQLEIRDAERLQGLPVDWTKLPDETSQSYRWKLVGNAVCVPVAKWVGMKLRNPGSYAGAHSRMEKNGAWPSAAFGGKSQRFVASEATEFPVEPKTVPILGFLRFSKAELSARACAGFHKRASKSSLRLVDGFLDAVSSQAERKLHSYS